MSERRKRNLFAIAVAIVATVVFGPVGGKVGEAIVAIGSKIGLSATVSSIVFRAGLGIALGSLAEANIPRVPTRGYETTQKGTALNHQIIYGKTRVAGVVLLDETSGTNNKFLHRVIAIAGHEINSYEEVWLNDYKLTVNLSTGAVTSATNDGGATTTNRYNNYVTVKGHLGSPTQSYDSDLIANTSLTTNDTFSGIAYLYVKLTFSQEVFPNGIPEIQVTVKGKKVFDPRDNTTAWSANPALCIRDYLLSDYGLNEEADYIDDDLVGDAADYCDVTASDSNNFFNMNGAFTTGVIPADVLSDMLTSMQGVLWYGQGQWRMRAAPAKISQSNFEALVTLTLNEDDLRGPIQVGTRHSRRDNFNVIKGTFRGEGTDWQVTDYPEYKVAAAITDDGEQESVLDLPLPFTTEVNETQRIARIAYERNRQQLTVSATFGLNAFKCQVGDFIRFDYDRMGWNSSSIKYWEVVEWSFSLQSNELLVNLVLREISYNVFDEVSSYTSLEKDNTSLISVFDVDTPTLSSPTQTTNISGDGVHTSNIKYTWSIDNSDDIDYYVFGWRLGTTGNYTEVRVDNKQYEINNAISGQTYNVFVKAVNYNGVGSTTDTDSVVASADATVPSAPTTLSATANENATIRLTWAKPTTNTSASGGGTLEDLRHYVVYRSTSPNAASKIAVVSASGPTGTFLDSGLDSRTKYYYRVKAVDYSDNASDFSSEASAETTSGGEQYAEIQVADPYVISGNANTELFYAVNMAGGAGDFWFIRNNGTGTLTPTFSNNDRVTFNNNIISQGVLVGGGSYIVDIVAIERPTEASNTDQELAALDTLKVGSLLYYAADAGYEDGSFTEGITWRITEVFEKQVYSASKSYYFFRVTRVSGSATVIANANAETAHFKINYQLKGEDGTSGDRGAGRWNIGISSVTAGSFVTGTTYWITTVGTTDFTAIGASSNTVGTSFTATGAGSGTGTATPLPTTSSTADSEFTTAISDPVDFDQAWFYAGTEASPIAQKVWIYDATGDSWTEQTEVIDGNLLVDGTITADKIAISDESANSRIEIVSNKILVYNGGVLRVKIGDLS